MTHEDAGKRHSTEINEMIAARIRERMSENTISCAKAHSIAEKLNADPADVGATIDLLEVRKNKYQLRTFRQSARGKSVRKQGVKRKGTEALRQPLKYFSHLEGSWLA